MSKHYVSFYFRPATQDTLQIRHTSPAFNTELCGEELEDILHVLKEGYQGHPRSLLKISALVEVTHYKDFLGEASVEHGIEDLEVTYAKDWSELRYIWGSVLLSEGFLNSVEKDYFFSNVSKR